MKPIKGLTLRRLGNESMLVAESPDLIDFDRIVSLNDSAAYIWECIRNAEFDTESVARLLTDRYDIDEETARNDAEELLTVWMEAGIIEA